MGLAEFYDFMQKIPDEIDFNDAKAILATNITVYRKQMKLSRAALAERIGITEAAVGQYERGTRTPQIDIICNLANVFNVSVDVLVGHGTGDYDAVMEYRFEQASSFVRDRGFFLFETPEGLIKICQYKDKQPPQFHRENGVVSTKKDTSRLDTIIEFSDRRAFISFVEWLIDFIFSYVVFREIFFDYMLAITNGWDYEPNLILNYKGNSKTDPYASI